MQAIYPPKLQYGDHIRVIAPSRSGTIIGDDTIAIALTRLQEVGFTISFGKHINEYDEFFSSSTSSRIQDLHDAFLDDSVQGIFTVIGGYNSNQLLNHIDYDIIKNNPKILCGFSDITTLSNAIFQKTGVVGYSGPHFSSWGMKQGFDYTKYYFEQCCMQGGAYTITPSTEWSDDPWYRDQEQRDFIQNNGYWSINEGEATGVIIGGHLPCIGALQGTSFYPQVDTDILLFLELDAEFSNELFDRYLQSLIQQPLFHKVQGIVIGRFQKHNTMTKDLLHKIIRSKPELHRIPILGNVDFGHTTPFFTFPIGGVASITSGTSNYLTILDH